MKVNAWTCAPATDRDRLLRLERWCMQPENYKVLWWMFVAIPCKSRYTWVQGRKTNRTIRITVAQHLYQVKWMIEGITCRVRPILKL